MVKMKDNNQYDMLNQKIPGLERLFDGLTATYDASRRLRNEYFRIIFNIIIVI